MSQPLSRLFEKWLDAGGDRTFHEWLDEKRARAKAMRTPGAVIPVAYVQQMFAMQSLSLLNQNSIRQRMGPFGGVFSGIGGIFGGRVW